MDELFAFVVHNPKTGLEQMVHGVSRVGDSVLVMPCYAPTLKMLEQTFRAMAEEHAKIARQPVKVVMFSQRRDLETIKPPAAPKPRAVKKGAKKK